MNRGLTSASLTELSGSAVEGYNLIRMDFAGFPLYVTDCPHEKTHDGNVYTPAAYISKFPAVKESLSIKANGISLGMSGVGLDTHTLSLMKHKGVDVYIYKWIEGVTSQVVPTFIGFIDSYISNENHAAGSAEIVWKITNHFANWDVVNGRKISDEGQKVLHPADDGFKFVGVTDPVTSLWGDKPFLDFSHYTPPVFRKSSFWNQQYFDIWQWGVEHNWSSGNYDWDARKENDKMLPVVYGRAALTGEPVFRTTTGTNGENLWVVYAICEGEVDSLEATYFNGVDSRHGDIDPYINVVFYNGTTTQTADPALVSVSPDWTVDCRLQGVAYAIVIYTKNEIWSGEPKPQFVIKGKKLFDPRSSLTVYSQNNVLALRDYLSSTIYGKGIDVSLFSNVNESADVCDELVWNHDGWIGGNPAQIERYKFNGVIETAQKVKDNANEILFTMFGYIPWVSGSYVVTLEAEASGSSYSFDETNINGTFTTSEPSIKSYANIISYAFKDSRTHWSAATEIVSSATYLADDNGVVLEKDVSNRHETDRYRARHLAETLLKKSREQIGVKFTAARADAIKIETGNLIDITKHSKQWAGKLFRVTEISIKPDSTVAISAIEYEPTTTDWTVGVEVAVPPNSVLSTPFFANAPTNLQLFSGTDQLLISGDGTIISRIKGTFVKTDDAFVGRYIVLYKLSTETVYTQATEIDYRDEAEFYISPCADGLTYNVRIYAINLMGIRSSNVDLNYVCIGKSEVPTAPTNLVEGSVDVGVVNLAWDEIADLDVDHYEIWASTTNNRLTASKVGTEKTGRFNHAVSTERWYWVLAVDTSKLASAFHPVGLTSGVHGTPDGATTSLEWADVLDSLGTKPEDNATLGATWGVDIDGQPAALVQTFFTPAAPTVGMDTGDYWIDILSGNLLHRYNGTSWLEIQDTDIADALLDAFTAQTVADQKIKTYYQNTAPTGLTALDDGDLWFETDNNYKPSIWIGGSLVWAPANYDVASWYKILDPTNTMPDDNATVGAIWSGNISGQPADSVLVNSYNTYLTVGADQVGSAADALVTALTYTDSVVQHLAVNAYAGTDSASAYATADKVSTLIFELSNEVSWPESYGGVVTHWYATDRATQICFGSAGKQEHIREVHPSTYPVWSAWVIQEIYSSADVDALQTLNGPAEANATDGGTWNVNIDGVAIPDSFYTTVFKLHDWFNSVAAFSLSNASLNFGLEMLNASVASRVFKSNDPRWTWDVPRYFSATFVMTGSINHSATLLSSCHLGGAANGSNMVAGFTFRRRTSGTGMEVWGMSCNALGSVFYQHMGSTCIFFDGDNVRFEMKTNGGFNIVFKVFINGTEYSQTITNANTPSGVTGANFLPHIVGAASSTGIVITYSDYYIQQGAD